MVRAFARLMTGLAAEAPDNKTISVDATYLKAHRTASSLGLKKGDVDAYGFPQCSLLAHLGKVQPEEVNIQRARPAKALWRGACCLCYAA